MRTQLKSLAGTALAAACLLSSPVSSRAAKESVTVIARFVATPGREAELEARLLKTVEFVRKAEPAYTYRLHRSSKDPSVFLFYEIYPSQAAVDQHSNVTLPASRREFGPLAEGLLARPPEIERFTALTE